MFFHLHFTQLFRGAAFVICAAFFALTANAATQTDIAGLTGSSQFGTLVYNLPNGNIVVTDPGYSIGATANVGVVRLYNGATNALISTLTGSKANDNVGNFGVTVLTNGNYVVSSPSWDNGSLGDAGAATCCDFATGVGRVVSTADSTTQRSGILTVAGQVSTVMQSAAPDSMVSYSNGQILFISRRDGNDEIYKMNADGSNQQRLTNSPEAESNAKWSPDNQKILYNKPINSTTSQIWVMNADGSNQTVISDAGYNVSPGWSPNGQKIVFSKGQNNTTTKIWTMNADGSNKIQLTNTATFDHFPVWSPDGSKIAFGRCDSTSFLCNIFTMNATGSNQTNLTPDNPNDDDSPRWTPNWNKIVFARQNAEDSNYNVYAVNTDGTNKQPLTNDSVQDYLPAAVSPNGNLVAMGVRPDGVHLDIATVGINGNNLANLTNNSDNDFFGVWSPDNTKIAFTRGTASNTYEIYVMNADGNSVIRLTNNSVYDSVTDWQAIPSYTVSTPAGQNIGVAPTNNLNLNFSNVMSAGNTVATALLPNQLQPLPSGFALFGNDLIYDITTSASFAGNITVTFTVPNVADAATCANLRSLHYENGAWTTDTNATPIYNTGMRICTLSQTVTSLSPFAVVKNIAPSASSVTIGGRVRTTEGRGIRNALLTLTDIHGQSRTVSTGSFGYYRFENVAAGRDYIISVAAKRYSFNESSRLLSVTSALDGINFTPLDNYSGK